MIVVSDLADISVQDVIIISPWLDHDVTMMLHNYYYFNIVLTFAKQFVVWKRSKQELIQFSVLFDLADMVCLGSHRLSDHDLTIGQIMVRPWLDHWSDHGQTMTITFSQQFWPWSDRGQPWSFAMINHEWPWPYDHGQTIVSTSQTWPTMVSWWSDHGQWPWSTMVI